MGDRLLRNEFGDHFNIANDIFIELSEPLSRNPVFQMCCGTYLANRELTQIGSLHSKLSHVSGTRFGIRRIPIPGYLNGVILIEHGIENRLSRKAGRKTPVAARLDQIKLGLAHRPKEKDGVIR